MAPYYIHAFQIIAVLLSNFLIYHYFFSLYQKLIIAKMRKLMHNRCAGAKITIRSKMYQFDYTINLNFI